MDRPFDVLGVKVYLMWLVVDSEAFPLNGMTKPLTPSLRWPRKVDQSVWEKTGLSPLSSGVDARRVLFGE